MRSSLRAGAALLLATGAVSCGGGDDGGDSGENAGGSKAASDKAPSLAEVKRVVESALPRCAPLKEAPQTGTVAPENVLVYCANGALVFGYERFDAEAERKTNFTQADDSHATFAAGGVVVEFSDSDGDLKTFEEDDPKKGLALAQQVSKACGCGEARPGSG